jgi:hypothetical protein
MQYHFVNVVWGERFTDLLIKVILPNHLTPGNLGHFRDKPGCRYRIFTTETDARRLRAAPIFAKLDATLPVDLVIMPGLGERGGHVANYEDMTACHRQAIVEGEREGAAMVFLAGDTVVSEGSFQRLAALCEAGYAAVLVCGIRVVFETYVEAFIERFFDPATLEARAEARALVAHALPHLHPLITSCFLDSDRFISFPSNLIVPVEGRGLLLRSFHYHPALIKPMVTGNEVMHTIDYSYLKHACPDPSLIHVVEDSDEIVMVSIDREAHRSDLLMPNKFNLTRLASFARDHADDFQQSVCLERVFRFHADEPGPAWVQAERKVSLLADRLRFALTA